MKHFHLPQLFSSNLRQPGRMFKLFVTRQRRTNPIMNVILQTFLLIPTFCLLLHHVKIVLDKASGPRGKIQHGKEIPQCIALPRAPVPPLYIEHVISSCMQSLVWAKTRKYIILDNGKCSPGSRVIARPLTVTTRAGNEPSWSLKF